MDRRQDRDLAKTDLWKTVQVVPSRPVPGGESIAEMQSRMVAALEQVVADHPGELIVVVSHADPIKAAIAHFSGVHLDLFQRVIVSPASVTVFELVCLACEVQTTPEASKCSIPTPSEPEAN